MDALTGGYFTFATRRPGPSSKVWPDANHESGWVCHSMEGWWATNDTLDDPERGSWHGTLLTAKNGGGLIQHYATAASPWASGSREANKRFNAWELEGVAGTPMDSAQLATAIRMYRAWRAAGHEPLTRGQNLFDHNEVATRWEPNAGPTACPSNRWAPFYAWLASDENTVDRPAAGVADVEELRAQIAGMQELLTDARADIYQLQVQVFGEAAAEAGRTDAYAKVAGLLATNGQLAAEMESLRGGAAGAVPAHIHAPVPSGNVLEAKG